MPAGQDLIFFDNPADWEVAADQTRYAQEIITDKYAPIPAFKLGLSLESDYIAAIVTTSFSKPTWQFAGDITQVYSFSPGSGNALLNDIHPVRQRLLLNRLTLIETNRVSIDRFDLEFKPPYWFRDCAIRVYRYVGEATNFVEDTLFDIGEALGIAPSSNEGLILPQLEVIEELISDKFLELNNSRDAEIQLDDQREVEIQRQLNEIDAGIYTLAEGLSDLLTEQEGSNLRTTTQQRLNLDLGFL
jgi:hypothetical protein